jgi:hypothetical protein
VFSVLGQYLIRQRGFRPAPNRQGATKQFPSKFSSEVVTFQEIATTHEKHNPPFPVWDPFDLLPTSSPAFRLEYQKHPNR